MMTYPRYTVRTVSWGHWGIDFMAPQTDPTRNYGGSIVHRIAFPVGTRGPCDMDRKAEYEAACRAWVERGELPA